MKDKICGNCLLYDRENGCCKVTVIHEGSYYELPVLPADECFWLKNKVEVNQIRAWSNGKNGYIEMPDDCEMTLGRNED